MKSLIFLTLLLTSNVQAYDNCVEYTKNKVICKHSATDYKIWWNEGKESKPTNHKEFRKYINISVKKYSNGGNRRSSELQRNYEQRYLKCRDITFHFDVKHINKLFPNERFNDDIKCKEFRGMVNKPNSLVKEL